MKNIIIVWGVMLAALGGLLALDINTVRSIRAEIAALDERITGEEAARITAGAALEQGIDDTGKASEARWEEAESAITALREELDSMNAPETAQEPQEEAEAAEGAELNADGVDVSGWDFYGTYGCTAYYNPKGNHTASGTWPTAGRTVACNYLDFGTQIYIEGLGYRTVEDNGYIPDNVARFDVFFDTYSECMNWGVQTRRIWIVK